MNSNLHELIIENLEAITRTASEFLEQTRLKQQPKVVAFLAPMGTGKTTFIKALCTEMGCSEVTNSPSFAIVNEYGVSDGAVVFHMDCYRLKDEQEALDLGFEEYLYSGCICLVEWPEVIASILPSDTLIVQIETLPNGSRRLFWEN